MSEISSKAGATRAIATPSSGFVALVIAWGAWLIVPGVALLSAQEPAVPRGAAPRALLGADTVRSSQVVRGVRHHYAWDAAGPWAIHVLEIDARACGVALEARKAGPPLSARATTSTLATGAVAGVNADFFRIPGGTTVGAHVQAGEVLIGPGDRPVIGFAAGDGALAGRVWISTAALVGRLAHGRDTVGVLQVNRAETPDTAEAARAGARLFSHWYSSMVEVAAASPALVVRRVAGSATAGTGVIRSTIRDGSVLVDPGMLVVRSPERGLGGFARLVPGDTVVWTVELRATGDVRGRPAQEAVGGYPVLVRKGQLAPDRLDARPGFGRRRHPRTAVGISTDDERLLLVTVDGRQMPYSDGMTLDELAELLLALGAEEALNLDGGGSTTMVVGGKVVNRPSDEAGERPVGNVLVVVERECRAAVR